MSKFSVTIQTPAYQKLINDTLGDKEIARRFVAEISTVVSQNQALANCDPATVLSAGLLAQTLNLSLAPTLGYAYAIPYGGKAQFQIGWKGLVQLAQRSNQYARLGVRPVHKGEYIGQDEMGDDTFKFDHAFDNEEIIGYYAYFELVNGFKKTVYWTKEMIEKHAKKYSQAYRNGKSTKWNDEFDAMAMKTVLKQLLSKWGPMSTEMITAFKADQAVINADGSYKYVDTEEESSTKSTVKLDNVVMEAEETEEEQAVEEKFPDAIDPDGRF